MKTYIEFLNENFKFDGKRTKVKESCPAKIHTDAILGGFPRVLVENQDQYLPVTRMTVNKMVKNWLKQAKNKN